MLQRDILSYVVSAEAILSRVDEYTLYCHYLEFEPELGKKYISRVRGGDDRPSFTLFLSKKPGVEYYWKDHGSTLHGDVFDMIAKLHGETRQESYLRVNRDFSLGLAGENLEDRPKIVYNNRPPIKSPVQIKIKSKRFNAEALLFWAQFGITLPTLRLYNVTLLDYFYVNDKIITPKQMAFAYRILRTYKIYQPHNLIHKFINNYAPDTVEGLSQLVPADLLIITKATKDIMFFRELELNSVAGKSENTFIPRHIMQNLLKHYKRVIPWLDNDEAGINAAAVYAKEYGLKPVMINPESGIKDPTDFRKLKGPKETKQLISDLLHIKL